MEKRHHKYFLRFSYTEEVSLTKTDIKEQTICSVDLGINTDAVCTIMQADGTVLGRKFIDFPSDKDRLHHVLGRIRRFQRQHGSGQTQSRWAYAKRLNMELARKTAAAITTYAAENHADVIVFEYLEMQGKISGTKKQRLHLWRKQYNCDLSAAYNIGARYFIRELLKPFSETERSLLEAKVPSVKRRTSCVYADLRLLSAELASQKAA